jgi:hypothetical protein
MLPAGTDISPQTPRFWTYCIQKREGREQVKNNWQSMNVFTFWSFYKLHLKVLFWHFSDISMIKMIFPHTAEKALTLDGTGTDTQRTPTRQEIDWQWMRQMEGGLGRNLNRTITLTKWPFNMKNIYVSYWNHGGHVVARLRHYATSQKVAGSIPDVTGLFNLPNPSSCTMALGSTQPLLQMGTRNLPGGKRVGSA